MTTEHKTATAVHAALKQAGKATRVFFKHIPEAANDELPLVSSARTLLDTAKARKIKTQAEYEAVAADLLAIAALTRQVETERKAITSPVDAAKSELQAFFKGPAEFLVEATKINKAIMADYLERKAAKEAGQAAKQALKAEQLNSEADAAVAAGDLAKAAKLRQRAAAAGSKAIGEGSKVEGIATSQTYSAEVFDLQALIFAVAEGKAPAESLQANASWLNKHAQALKRDFNLPGVRLVNGTRIAARPS